MAEQIDYAQTNSLNIYMYIQVTALHMYVSVSNLPDMNQAGLCYITKVYNSLKIHFRPFILLNEAKSKGGSNSSPRRRGRGGANAPLYPYPLP